MSCGNPVVEGKDALMERKTKFDKSVSCVKCKTERGKLVIRYVVYCKSCFFLFVATKFRRCLEPHINESSQVPKRKSALKAAGNLLVGFSGGLGSTILANLLTCTYFPSPDGVSDNGKGGRSHPRNKRVWTRAFACYVEICNAFPEGKMKDRTEDIRRLFNQSKHFEYVPARLEDAFDPEWWGRIGGRPPEHAISTTLITEDLPLHVEFSRNQRQQSPVSLLRGYLASLPTQTAVQSSISSLIRIILTYTARDLRCSHLALGTTLTSLSVALISGIAQGGGFNIREEYLEKWRDSSDDDSVDDDQARSLPLRVIRPLHDVGMKECAAWAYWKGLSVVGSVKLPGITGKQTIGSLTKDFIIGLERDYPSTVSTIVRTCSKVEAKDDVHDRCVLCERAIPFGVLDWKTRTSIRSLDQCRSSPTSIISDEMRDPDQPRTVAAHLLSPRLCYACHTHFTSRSPRSVANGNTTTYLPQWTNAHLGTSHASSSGRDEVWFTSSMDQEEMRETINDLLLQD